MSNPPSFPTWQVGEEVRLDKLHELKIALEWTADRLRAREQAAYDLRHETPIGSVVVLIATTVGSVSEMQIASCSWWPPTRWAHLDIAAAAYAANARMTGSLWLRRPASGMNAVALTATPHQLTFRAYGNGDLRVIQTGGGLQWYVAILLTTV